MLSETKELLELMQKASGYSQEEILSGCRRIPLPTCRWIIGDELMKMGYSSMVVSRELNIDHATLLHGRKRIQDITSRNGWRIEVKMLQNFKRLLNADRQEEL